MKKTVGQCCENFILFYFLVRCGSIHMVLSYKHYLINGPMEMYQQNLHHSGLRITAAGSLAKKQV